MFSHIRVLFSIFLFQSLIGIDCPFPSPLISASCLCCWSTQKASRGGNVASSNDLLLLSSRDTSDEKYTRSPLPCSSLHIHFHSLSFINFLFASDSTSLSSLTRGSAKKKKKKKKPRKERENACRLSIVRLIHLFNETVVISISAPMLLRSTMR